MPAAFSSDLLPPKKGKAAAKSTPSKAKAAPADDDDDDDDASEAPVQAKPAKAAPKRPRK